MSSAIIFLRKQYEDNTMHAQFSPFQTKHHGLWLKYSVLTALIFIGMLSVSGCSSEAIRPALPLSISSIVQQSQAGVPAKSIIQQIANSGSVYRLSASQLADLRDKGVPNTVINYMQRTYIHAVRRNQSLIDHNYWVYGPEGYWYNGYPYGWPYQYVPYDPTFDEPELDNNDTTTDVDKNSGPQKSG
jgi:hypothetical protein